MAWVAPASPVTFSCPPQRPSVHEESVGQGGRVGNGAPAVDGLGQETSWAPTLLLSNIGVL